MDMIKGTEIAKAGLVDWRKLAQGLHARYEIGDFGEGARFLSAIGEAGDTVGHHPSVSMRSGYVDLKLVSHDAVFRNAEGTEFVVEWVTRKDVELARQITRIAAEHGLAPDPSSVSMLEIGLTTANADRVAPVWAQLLTGDAAAQGRGTPGDEVRDASDRVPHLMFQDPDDGDTDQRFHIEVYVPVESVAGRTAAAVAAGGIVEDDSDSPGHTVIADPDGNRATICADASAVAEGAA